ncbi:MAG: hypothetical protein GWN58_33390 [Anaerolineae bacterium]|nr:hypothetical protein [Thermoplasmata archaeon]NIV34171.1 hypothetical protein [Anaerolineae bacterium]NIY06022.1 hypothetical protein [Thermoplasmata archaeon]
MTALLALMRTAEGATQPTDADEEILDSLKSLSDDTEEVTAFLHNLIAIDQARASAYLVQCHDHLPELFDEVKTALEEEPMEEEEDLGEEVMEEEEMPPEEGQDDLPPMEDEAPLPEEGEDDMAMEPVDEEPLPEEGQDMPMPPVEEGQDEVPMEEPPMGQDEPMPPEMGEEEPVEELEEDEEEVAVEPVVDQDELETEEATADDLDMVLFQTDASKGPHWSVFYRGRPLCAIRLADQENPEEIAELFVTEEYPKHIQEACASPIGIRETLNSVNAHWYMGVIDTGQVATEARQIAAQQLEDEFATRLASLKEDLLNTINLAVVASNKGSKGLFVENKLKAACVQVLRDAGVVGASTALNEVWVEAAQTYMQDILKVAEKWLSYSPEAMQEVTAEIVGTEVEIDEEPEVETPADIQAEARRQVAGSAPQSVPIRTRQPITHGSEGDYRQATTQRVASTLSRRMGRRRLGS